MSVTVEDLLKLPSLGCARGGRRFGLELLYL